MYIMLRYLYDLSSWSGKFDRVIHDSYWSYIDTLIASSDLYKLAPPIFLFRGREVNDMSGYITAHGYTNLAAMCSVITFSARIPSSFLEISSIEELR